jgi:hypothetical protein
MRVPLVFASLGLLALGCNHSEPPSRPEPAPVAAGPVATPRPTPSVDRPMERASTGVASAPSASGAASSDAGASAPDASAARDAGLASLAPELLVSDGGVLPQTEDKPSLDSPWFQAGVHAIFEAIQRDDPSVAEPFFFPIEAYRAVKDVADPDRDWKRRLIANFRRDVHDYHKKLGPRAADARFESIDVPVERMRWMKPHTEGNKGAYYRVTHSRLHYRNAEGKAASLEVTSFISWRGEWYLVHLNGFK